MEPFNFGFSLKDIPIPSKDSYQKTLIQKTEEFIGRLRWAAYHFLNPNDKTKTKPAIDTYGFRTSATPPQIKELTSFENELYEMISKIEFRDRKYFSQHQNKLLKCVKDIQDSDKIFLLADKTRNIYKVSPELYNKLLINNVTKDYQIIDSEIVDSINREAKSIAEEMKIADRIEAHSETPAFITFKDHKPNHLNDPKCRLINPAKSQMGIISKQILQKANQKLRETTGLQQWQSTPQFLEWFKMIENKTRKSFLQLDIVEFYPSISEQLLKKAFIFANRSGASLTDKEEEIILHARRSILYARSRNDGNPVPWQKTTGDFDVTMGAPDGAEACELVGLYLLDQVNKTFPNINFGLYRDDGLGTHNRMTGRQLDQTRQGLERLFNKEGLKITIETGMKQADFLDVTVRLDKEDFRPYKKPNDSPLYVNTKSNHPPNVIKQIPAGINKRLSTISSSKEHFDQAKEPYQKALRESGHDFELEFVQPEEDSNTQTAQKRKRCQRKLTWYNPPYNQGIKTNLGNKFLKLVRKHFTKKHALYTICNKNTLKLSYSCTRNMKTIFQTHNQKLLSKKANVEDAKKCDCQRSRKDKCPLNGSCVQKNVIYQVTTDEQPPRKYIGSTEDFKKRYAGHTQSFRHETHRNSTTLSQHVWDKQLGKEPKLVWEIISKAHAYTKGARACSLCLGEKLQILKQFENPAYLNRRNEIAQKCRHRAKFRLGAIK